MTDHRHGDRETIVVREGSSVGTILAVVAIIALLVAIWYFTLGPGGGAVEQGGTDAPEVPVPTLEQPAQNE
jgi:hypothetical protein